MGSRNNGWYPVSVTSTSDANIEPAGYKLFNIKGNGPYISDLKVDIFYTTLGI